MPSRFSSKFFGRDKLSKAELEKFNKLKSELLNCYSLIRKGNYEKGLSLAKRIYKEVDELGKRPILVDTIICQGYALFGLGKLNECLKIIEEGENLLLSIDRFKKKKLAEKQAMLNELKGNVYRRKGDSTLASELLKKSLSVMEGLKNKEAQAGLLNNIGITYASKGEFDLGLEYLQQSIEKFEELGNNQPKLRLFNNFGLIYALKGDLDQALEYYQKSLDLSEKTGDQQSKATSLLNISQIFQNKGELESALENSQNALTIFKDLDCAYEMAICLNLIGIIYELKGELYQAHDVYTESFTTFRELENKPKIAMSYNNIGNTYLDGGDIEQAISHYQESLKLLETDGNNLDICITLFNLISVNVQRGLIENSRQYLQNLQEINDKSENKAINQIYTLSKALVLKTSERVVKRAEAQQIFLQTTKEKTYDYEFIITAKKNLCELLIQELTTSGNEEIISEIKEISQDLLSIAEKQGSNSLLIETNILQSKMALLELDLDTARQLLSQARQSAEEKGLQRLAVLVSREYDFLLTQLSKWPDLADRDVSLVERLELAELESMVTRLIRKKAEIAELSEEEPVLFLILARSGMSMFSKHFVSESLLAEQLIAGFLTAINAFTQQAFSESGSIEGIKHKEYTILMKPTDPLLCCYVFKGPSYYALQKLKNFSDTVKVSDTIWDMILKASTIGRDISGETAIENLVTKTFLSSSETLPQSTSEVFFGKKMNATISHGIYLDIFSFSNN